MLWIMAMCVCKDDTDNDLMHCEQFVFFEPFAADGLVFLAESLFTNDFGTVFPFSAAI